jgi:hypothetical protein
MRLRWLPPSIGIALLVPLLYFYIASGLVSPGWAVVTFLVLWLVLLALAIAWFRRRPYAVLALPVAGFAVWFLALWAGGTFLGWTA